VVVEEEGEAVGVREGGESDEKDDEDEGV